MDKLDQIAQEIATHSIPPVHLWNPKHKGTIDIQIDANANWFHEGAPIRRSKLVALFSSILWCEENLYFLVTPAEKLEIEVSDVPYIIRQAELVNGAWVVTTNTEESIIISRANPVELRLYKGVWLPYILVRYDIWARVNRSIYYQWVELALAEPEMSPNESSESLDGIALKSGDYNFSVAKE